MDILMIILRLIHIIGGVFWVGGTFFMAGLISPTAKEAGEAGQKFMQQLGLHSNLSQLMGISATLTFLSGLWMYGEISGFHSGWITSGYGAVLTFGAIFGFAGWLMGFLTQFRTTQKMKALSVEMAAAGGPPKPEQIAEMQSLAAYMTRSGQILAIVLALSLVGMSAAQYVAF